MLQINGLTKKFGRHTVLDDVSLSLENKTYGLLGENGAGKTTLFRILTGLQAANAGVIKYKDIIEIEEDENNINNATEFKNTANTIGLKDITETIDYKNITGALDQKSITKSIACKDSNHKNTNRNPIAIGYLPQKFGAFEHLTVEEQFRYFAYLKARKDDGISWKEEVERAIAISNLQEQRRLKCGKLSGGMVRRLGIAQAAMGRPDLILLDEPEVGLDIAERKRLVELLDSIRGRQPIVISSHIAESMEDTCQEILVLHKGKIVFQGTPDALKTLADNTSGKEPTIADGYLSLM